MAKSKLFCYALYYKGKEVTNAVAESDSEGVWGVLRNAYLYGKDKGASADYVIQRRPFEYGKPNYAVDKLIRWIYTSSTYGMYEWWQISMKTGKVGAKHEGQI